MCAAEELRADRAYVLVDREIALAADALRLAAEELRADRAYVLAGVQTQTLLCCADLTSPAIPGLPWLAARIYWYL